MSDSVPSAPALSNWDQVSAHFQNFDRRIKELQQQQQAALQQQQAALQPAAAAAPVRTLKPTNPETFDGVSKNLSVSDWLFQCRCFFEAVGLHELNPERTVFAAALLRGAAGKWWKQETEAADRGDKPKIRLWSEFSAAIKTRFQTIDASQVARDRLAELRQLGSVVQYVNLFQQVINDISDISPSELLHRFLAGLKRSIRLDVEMYRVSHPDLTLADAMTVAQRADAARSKYAPFRRDYSYNNPKTAAATGHVSEEPDVVMSLNAMKNNSFRAKLTDQEKNELMQDGRCFYCKEKGHIASRCPIKAQKNF